MIVLVRLVVSLVACAAVSLAHAQPKPAFLFDSMLDRIYFDDDSGLISFTDMNLAFAPEGPLNAAVAVVNSDDTVVQSFEFYPEERFREGVFMRAQVKGPADVSLTDPGVYNIVFLVDGEMASRLPVVLEQVSKGDDPFDPVKEYEYYGLWQRYAYFTIDEYDDGDFYKLWFWVGGRDLAEGDDDDMYRVTLKRDGEVIGHSKHTQGYIGDGHYERVDTMIYEPHEDRDSVNAERLPLSECTENGEYEVLVTRKSDGKLIRRFIYTASDGEIEELPNTKLGYEPRIDYIVPRVPVRGANSFRMERAVWIRAE